MMMDEAVRILILVAMAGSACAAFVETTAVELERVGEAQRFQARLAEGTK